MGMLKKRAKWLILAMANIVIVLFSCLMIYHSNQDESGAAFCYLDESAAQLTQVYSTNKLTRGVYEASIRYKLCVGGGWTVCAVL